MENDIIAAIATAHGHGAIGIVRMTGDGVLDLLSRVFLPVTKWESHRMYYGTIHASGEIVDEVMVCPMLAPRSYTREDTVEIYAHGGIVVLHSVLDAVIKEGARLAMPGEFTKRAFLNGRINLTQAEAVMDLINAGSDAARKAGLRQLGGGLSSRVEGIRNTILSWLAHIELSIDYPEHEDEAKTVAQILAEGGEVVEGLTALHATAAIGRMLRDGIRTAIIGRPNAGKSTLLNAILSEDRAIVHELAGTTRDVLTERVVVGGIPLVLMDTAGIRDTDNPVEKIGVEKTIEAAEEAELILYVVDAQEGLSPEDKEMLAKMQDKPIVLLLNKCDTATGAPFGILELHINENGGHTMWHPPNCSGVVGVSAKTGQGMDTLYKLISNIFLTKGLGNANANADIITRERHRILIEQAISHVQTAMGEIEMGVPEDLVSVNLRAAYMALGEVLGVEVADDILDRIFAEFCLGK